MLVNRWVCGVRPSAAASCAPLNTTGAGIGTGLQVERRVANRGAAGHRVDKRLLHCLEDQVGCGPAGRHLIGVDDRVKQLTQPQCATMSAVSPRSKPLVSTTLMPAARNRRIAFSAPGIGTPPPPARNRRNWLSNTSRAAAAIFGASSVG